MYDKKLAKKLDEFQPQKISISDGEFSQMVGFQNHIVEILVYFNNLFQ